MARAERAAKYHHGDLRSALLRAARELVEEGGPEALSFRAAARAAGVSQTAPYNHFESKEALLAGVAQDAFDALADSQAQARETGATPQDAIAAMALDYVRSAVANPQRYRLMFGGFFKDWSAWPAAKAAKERTFEPLKQALRDYPWQKKQGRREAVEVAAIAAWSLVHGIAMLRIDGSLHVEEDDDDAALARLVSKAIRLFLRGLD